MFILTYSGIFNCHSFEQIDMYGETIIGISALNPSGIVLYSADEAHKYHDIELDRSDKIELLHLVFNGLFNKISCKDHSCRISDLEAQAVKELQALYPDRFCK